MDRNHIVVAGAALLLLLPSAAGAATINGEPNGYVDYTAAPGETNLVKVVKTVDVKTHHDTLTLTDTGATITATGRCRTTDAHTAVCTPPDYVPELDADLGDGNDTFTAQRLRRTKVIGGDGDDTITAFIADGGAGDDHLRANSDFPGYLSGGPGVDTLVGGAEDDILSDADGGTQAHDTFDGGGGRDRVNYSGDTTGIVADLAGPAAANTDALSNVEDVIGGAGDDTIKGTGGPNLLAGGAGSDTIDGRGGDDQIAADKAFLHASDGEGDTRIGEHDDVRDTIIGGPGDDQLDLGGKGTATCGDGTDRLAEPDPATVLDTACESVLFFSRPNFNSPRDAAEFAAQPLEHTAGTITLGLGCARNDIFDFGERQRCSGSVTLLSTGGSVLGKAKFNGDAADRKTIGVVVALNAAGRKVVKRGGPITEQLGGDRTLHRARWTFRL